MRVIIRYGICIKVAIQAMKLNLHQWDKDGKTKWWVLVNLGNESKASLTTKDKTYYKTSYMLIEKEKQ